MNLEKIRACCLAFPGVTEEAPFGPEVPVYKVMGKMFALISPDDVPPSINLKCDPDRALDLRDQYEAIQPGYHMSKKHWNTVLLDGSLPYPLIQELIDHSYELVVGGLTKKDREKLQQM